MNHLTRAKSVFEMEIEELRGVLSRLDDNFNKAVDLMSQALDRGNKIVIVGVGKSGNIGAKIVATLNSTGTPTVLLDSLNALLMNIAGREKCQNFIENILQKGKYTIVSRTINNL